MFADYDEGLGVSPTHHSIHRDYPTFLPEDDSYAPTFENPQKSFIFPQKLDLSQFPKGRNKSRNHGNASKKKKLSPIKAHHDSALNPRAFRAETSIRGEQTVDLDSFRKEIEEIAANVLNNSMRKSTRSQASSVTSDRAGSVSSTSTSSRSQRSLSVQIKRTEKLINRINTERAERIERVFDDTDFHITSGDETRPPSSQASLTFEVDRHARQTSDVITTRHYTKGPSSHPQRLRNAGTSTSVVLSDTFLQEIYSKRSKTRREDEENDATLVEIVDKTMENPVFDVETPILSSADSGYKRIETGRNACSSMAITHFGGEKETRKDPPPPPTVLLHHSLSSSAVPVPQQNQLRTQQVMFDTARINRSLPNILDRFVVRPSTREIFNTPLDIDAICGKGVRRNQKSSDRIFGGSEIARNIHGEPPSKPPPSSARRPPPIASRPTTASTAKQRVARNIILPPRHQQPPYCSATSSDGIPYSLATVSQQLLGAVKSLHPDWLQMTRRLLDDKTITDLPDAFSTELEKEQTALEWKYSRNQRHGAVNAAAEEFDDHRTKLCVIFRILEKIRELRSRGGQYSRVHQIKLIQNALFSA